MAGGAGVANNIPRATNRDRPGLFGRLLHRTKSTKGTDQSSPRRKRVAGLTDFLDASDVASSPLENPTTAPSTLVPDDQRHLDLVRHKQHTDPAPPESTAAASHLTAVSQPHPKSDVAAATAPIQQAPLVPTATAVGSEMPSLAPQQPGPAPQLRKKASIRDRLRSWQKPAPTTVEEQQKPRFVYEPRHAAADFSRLAITSPPLTQQQLADDRRLATAPLQTLAENESASPDLRQQQPPKTSRRREERVGGSNYGQAQLSRSGSRSKRHSYTLVEDPWKASQAAAHVPINNRPVAWTPGVAGAASRSASDRATLTEEDHDWRAHSSDRETPLGADTVAEPDSAPAVAAPPSDFELFLARAEAEDRAFREQIWRSMSQRSAAMSHLSQRYHQQYVSPNPHRQYASAGSAASGQMSAATTAVSASGGHRNSGSGNYAYYSSGGESEGQAQGGLRRGHSKRGSWAPSYATGASDAERELEGAKKPAEVVVYGVDEGFEAKPARTLRRQASITQKIAEYIRPPREDAFSARPGSRTGSKRIGGQVRPVETLVE